MREREGLGVGKSWVLSQRGGSTVKSVLPLVRGLSGVTEDHQAHSLRGHLAMQAMASSANTSEATGPGASAAALSRPCSAWTVYQVRGEREASSKNLPDKALAAAFAQTSRNTRRRFKGKSQAFHRKDRAP